jgi:hypothetical protein
MMAHTMELQIACNSSYLGGGDQEDCSLRPAQARSMSDNISTNKKPNVEVFRVIPTLWKHN